MKTPLSLVYEPDVYLCTWSVPDGLGGSTRLPGSLEVRPKRLPRGTIYGAVPLQYDTSEAGVVSTAFPQVVEVPTLHGTMANGGSVVLLDARLEYWSTDQGLISGSAALLGKGSGFFGGSKPEEADPGPAVASLISSVTFQITGLDSILGADPIKGVSAPWMHEDNPKDVWSATLNSDAISKWASGSVSLSIGYDGRMRTADPYEFRLAFSPVATLSLGQGSSLRAVIDEYVEPLRRIISISTGRAQDLTYLAVEFDGGSYKHQVFGGGITQAPYASSTKTVRDNASAVRASPDGISLLGLILEWQQLIATHHPLVETYGSMLHATDQHPRSRYLLLIQALEGLYGFETKATYEQRVEKHQAKRQEILERVTEQVDPNVLTYLKKNLQKYPSASLDTALQRLMNGLPVDMMSRLAETDLVKDAMSDPAQPQTTASALRVIRNNLAHGNRGYAPHHLAEAVVILEIVVRNHSLRVLGCSNAVLERVFQEP